MKSMRILTTAMVVCAVAALVFDVVGIAVFHQPVGFDTVFVAGFIVIAVHFWLAVRRQERGRKLSVAANQRRTLPEIRFPVSAPHDYRGLVFVVGQRLRTAGYSVARDVTMPTGQIADLVATRASEMFDGVAVSPCECLLLRHVKTATPEDFDGLFETGFQFAEHTFGKPSQQDSMWAHVVLPCIAVDTATPNLIAAVSHRSPKRWLRYEFCVAYDLSTGHAYYYTGKAPKLGSMLFPSAQALVRLAFGAAQPAAV